MTDTAANTKPSTDDERRIANRHVPIDYEATYRFFRSRAACGADKVVQVLYQDDNPALAHARSDAEFRTLERAVSFDGRSVLDIGCGTGRLADRIIDRVGYYFGFDLLAEFVETARASLVERAIPESRYGFAALPCNARSIEMITRRKRFDIVIMSGVSIYLNDEDFLGSLRCLAAAMHSGASLYLRDPIETADARLTLNRFMSNQLSAEYSVIYRGADEYRRAVADAFDASFDIGPLTPMYRDPALNGRWSTRQHYMVITRK
ncbi:class I SAM-dependent methyltransferase [Burkholderia thailandensis]|uniref:class I SAM-dependent methyltransferase n=1 Tax=Burkholderia thailandensis TaxID=57975 RepID=UPI00016A874B|nr:class I SAM-dependent methyltransferase [Burkholderia thailandensis]AHI82256.1 methyltransferase domain protein [Burkholderia thailandensis E444]AIC90357.1 methyltransferase domain protein [Burkholderia thailandensis USAMRU Malaysia \